MKVRVKWTEARRFIWGSGSGHRVIIDASATPQGETRFGPSPMEMLLTGMCGRTVSGVIAILKKMRPLVEGVVFELKAVRTDSPQRVFTKIHALFSIIGNMPLEKAEEVMSLTTDKSCSASRMLAEMAEITDEIKVIARKS